MSDIPVPTKRSNGQSVLCLALSLALIGWLSNDVKADVIAYEGFNYTPTTNWNGVANSTPWPSSGQNWTGTTNSSIIEGLSYGDLQVAGNSVQTTTALFRNLGPTSYSTGGKNYWFSALFQVAGTENRYAGVSLFNGTSERLFFGRRDNRTTWGIQLYSPSGTANSSISAAGGATGFLVVEINSANKTVNLYVNPTLTENKPATPTVSLSGLVDFSFDRFRIQAGTSTQVTVDELRFGESWGDVTPQQAVPEPGSITLAVGLGVAAAVAGWRRRRRAA